MKKKKKEPLCLSCRLYYSKCLISGKYWKAGWGLKAGAKCSDYKPKIGNYNAKS